MAVLRALRTTAWKMLSSAANPKCPLSCTTVAGARASATAGWMLPLLDISSAITTWGTLAQRATPISQQIRSSKMADSASGNLSRKTAWTSTTTNSESSTSMSIGSAMIPSWVRNRDLMGPMLSHSDRRCPGTRSPVRTIESRAICCHNAGLRIPSSPASSEPCTP